jgi:hypothetical protein
MVREADIDIEFTIAIAPPASNIKVTFYLILFIIEILQTL